MNSSRAHFRAGFLVATLVLVTACAQTPRQKPPASLQVAERHNLLGLAAESRQKYAAAETEFMEAYRCYRAIENYHGIVTVLVNSSRLYRRLGNLTATDRVLTEAVAIVSQTPELEAEVSFEMTKLALARSDNAAAATWSSRAVRTAAEADRGRMLNLQALVYLQQTELGTAKEVAQAALKSSRGGGDRREEANALRLLGAIAYSGKLYRESQELYEAALSLDKTLALSLRISDDLRGIARSLAASGDLEAAALYYQRSAAINMAERERGRSGEDLELLRNLYERTNNRERLDETVKLLEKIRQTASNPGQ